jgi:hypothetical protein
MQAGQEPAPLSDPVEQGRERGRRRLVKVRELLELADRLSTADPEGTVVFDHENRCVIVVVVRPGMHQPFEEEPDLLRLTEQDKRFLQAMRIPY